MGVPFHLCGYNGDRWSRWREHCHQKPSYLNGPFYTEPYFPGSKADGHTVFNHWNTVCWEQEFSAVQCCIHSILATGI